MNGFVVGWTVPARQELAKIWVAASDQAAVARAQVEIDVHLARDPARGTGALSEGLMRIDVPPLTAYFAVDHDRRTVEVSWVILRL